MPTALNRLLPFDADSPYAKRARQHTRRSWLIGSAIGIAVGSFIVGAGWAIYTTVRPPIIIQNSRILNTVVPVNGDLSFEITSMMNVDLSCIGTVTREFYTPITINGADIRYKKRISGPAPIIHQGESHYAIGVTLPPNMWPGEWVFQGETTYDCGYVWALIKDFPNGLWSGGVVKFRTREMPFTVVAAK